MQGEILEVLPFTDAKAMKKPNWSFIYAYNLRTLRDIFVYCSLMSKINEEKLYRDIKNNVIAPPKERWVNWKNKRNDRLRLEYVHAAIYLGLIKKEKEFLVPDFSTMEKEKRAIILENENRLFLSSDRSPSFTEIEKGALLKIVLNHERARDFLRWFLDFSCFLDIYSFDEEVFRNNAKPIYVLGKIEKGKKGRDILKREIDGKTWKIPDEKPYDYTRLASFVLPSWFKDLGLIDEVIDFPEFSADGQLWHMYYPIRTTDESFLKTNLSEFLELLFSQEKTKKLWTPYIIFTTARKYNCSVRAIKKAVENVYRQNYGHYYLERAPAHLMKAFYKDSYIDIGGFSRSYLSRIG
jgi:hypothetical protein